MHIFFSEFLNVFTVYIYIYIYTVFLLPYCKFIGNLSQVRTTGQIHVGASGGIWAELDVTAGEKKGAEGVSVKDGWVSLQSVGHQKQLKIHQNRIGTLILGCMPELNEPIPLEPWFCELTGKERSRGEWHPSLEVLCGLFPGWIYVKVPTWAVVEGWHRVSRHSSGKVPDIPYFWSFCLIANEVSTL